MVNVFFICLILADLVYPELDKLPVLIYGILGFYYILSGIRLTVSPAESIYFLFLLLISVSTFFIDFIGNSRVYLVLFTLQLGIFSYITYRQKLDFMYLDKSISSFINWNVFIGMIGMLDFIVFQLGIISPIRDYFYASKVDSFYANPNTFGIMASFSLIFILVNIQGFRLKLFEFFKIIVLMISVGISTSSMAIGLVMMFFLYKLVKSRSFKMLVLLLLCMICMFLFIAWNADFNSISIQSLLNKRLELWRESIRLWFDSPMFGIGTGNFQFLNEVEFNGVSSTGEFGLHSLFLWLIVETGIIGSLFFSVFLLSVFYESKKRLYRKPIAAIFILILTSQLTEFYLDHEEIFIMIFWIIVVSCTVPNNLYSRFSSKYSG